MVLLLSYFIMLFSTALVLALNCIIMMHDGCRMKGCWPTSRCCTPSSGFLGDVDIITSISQDNRCLCRGQSWVHPEYKM
jgi:hypothetical protein